MDGLQLYSLTTHAFYPKWITNVTSAPPSVELPSKESFYQKHQFPLYVLQTIVILFGVLTNLVNILTFLRIGLSDCVTISFFHLAISDLLHLACFAVIRLMTILTFEHGISSSIVRLQDLGGWFGWMSVYFMDTSMYITVFASVQKCCCVVFPLKFKNVFTRKLSWIVIVSIFLATLAIFMPVYSSILRSWFFDPKTKDKPLNWIQLNSGREATIWRWTHRITLTIISQIVVLLSLATITVKLKKSVKFRASAKSSAVETTINQDGQKSKTGSNNNSPKEMRVIQSVQVIALIFLLSTFPTTINSLVSVAFPQLYTQPRYRSVVLTIQAIMYFGGTINASVNIFVYLVYNTKYKSTFMGYCKLSLESGKVNSGVARDY